MEESIFAMYNQQRPLGELEPYLAGLNVSEALEDFGRLADLVLSTRCCSPGDEGLTSSPAPSSGHYAGLSDPSSPEGDTCHFYLANGGIPTPASSQWLSQPPSPTASYSGSNSSRGASCYSSSLSLSSSSSSISRPHSRAPSSFDDDASASSSRPRRRRRCGSGSCGGGGGGGSRKRQNATAAERYRRRMKGRKSGLEEELERERERHSRLLASFESKMLLYREFARLLAANTRDPMCDSGLARVGSRSLESVLECVAPLGLLGEPERCELEHLLEHFKCFSAATAAAAPSGGCDQPQFQ